MKEEILKKIKKKLRQLTTLYPMFFFWFDFLPKEKSDCKIIIDRFSKAINNYYIEYENAKKRHIESINKQQDKD